MQEGADRNFSYLSMYHVGPQKFVRLADDECAASAWRRSDKFAIGFDDREYELMGNLDGRRFRDVYVVNPATGERKLALKRARWYNGPSPDGESLLYYEDGHFFVHSMATGQSKNITLGAPASFIDTEDDHNVVKPPTQPLGWTKDSKSVLISDNWDIWQVPVDGGAAVNLTVNGRKDQIRYQRRLPLEPLEDRDDGIDLSKPQYFAVYGEWTKKGGIAPARSRASPGSTNVLWGDAAFSRLTKAEKADVLLYTQGDRARAGRLLRHRHEVRRAEAADRHAPAGGAVQLDARRPAGELHLRQGRQAAGGAVPAGQLREGQGLSDGGELLREDVADRQHVRERRPRTASTARSTPATATPC